MNKRHTASLLLLLCLLTSHTLLAQFQCDAKLYFFREGTALGNNGKLSYFDGYTPGGTPTVVDLCDMPSMTHNALGGNPKDGFLYYLDGSNLKKLSQTCVATQVCSGLPAGTYSGCFDNQGRYCYLNPTTYSIVVYDIQNCTTVKTITPSVTLSGTIYDITFNLADCNFWTTTGSGVYGLDSTGQLVSNFTVTMGGLGVTYGAMAFGQDGRLYAAGGPINSSSGSQGDLYAIDLTAKNTQKIFNYTPSPDGGNSDMASFPCNDISADFSFNIQSGGVCGSSLAVDFTGSSLPPTANYWDWDFGDPGSGSSNTSTLKTPSHTFSAAGTYTVTLTATVFAGQCNLNAANTVTKTVTVSTTASMTIGVTSTNASCGAADGTATVTSVSNGTPSYTYTWNTGPSGTASSISGLSASTYTVTVTDSRPCTATATFTISAPVSNITLTTGSSPATCGSSNGSATVTATGSTSYSYLWAGSGQTSATATALSAGNYTVTVTDANGCIKSTVAIVTNTGGPTITFATSDPSCGLSNGSATATVSGGSGPYTYTWTPSVSSTATATNLSPGAYSLNVADISSCIGSNTFTLTDNTVLLNNFSLGPDTTLCTGKSYVLDADNAGKGASYAWLPTGQTTQAITLGSSVPSSATYSVVVTNGCGTKTDAVVVNFKSCQIKIPNVFTPVGDGINDNFVIDGILDFPNSHIMIYNRWGLLVWESYDYKNDWDGRHYKSLNRLSEGTYYYILDVSNGDKFHGFITLLRGYHF